MIFAQIYEHDKDMRLFDCDLSVTFERTGSQCAAGFTKSAATHILKRMGYDRITVWEKTDWGYEAEFERRRDKTEG